MGVGGRKPKMIPELVGTAQRMYNSRRFTMAEIAKACHVTSTTVYRHIRTDPPGSARGWPRRPGRRQNRVSGTRSGRYPVGPSWASSTSTSTSMAPKKLMFSLWAGETWASTSSSTRRPDRRIESTASP